MIVDQLLDTVMWDQEIPAPDKSQQGPPVDRENVLPLQSAPNGFQLLHALERGIARVIGAVEGADTGADHHIRRNSVRGERMHHAYLNGAKAATAREYKGRLREAGMIGYRQNLGRSRARRVGNRPRDVRPGL